jgi:hypothetical protein
MNASHSSRVALADAAPALLMALADIDRQRRNAADA